jgi:hypothetical protein
MSTMLDVMSPLAKDKAETTERLEAFHDLLPTLARALDVRDVFDHLSVAAARIVPHDEANLALLTDDGSRFRMLASTSDGAPELLCREDRCILRDLSRAKLFEPGSGYARGLRSGVSAPVRIEDQPIGVLAPSAASDPFRQAIDSCNGSPIMSRSRVAQRLLVAQLAAVERERAAVSRLVELLRRLPACSTSAPWSHGYRRSQTKSCRTTA